jgi:CRP-like cAMP-binding protein
MHPQMNGHRDVPMTEKDFRWLEKGLKGLGFFAKIDVKTLSTIIPHMVLVNVKPGKPVCVEGRPGHSFYLIYKGAVQVTKKGWDKPVAALGPGQFFGEMSVLFKQPRSATVTTTKAAKLFRLHSASFNRILRNNRAVARTIRKIAEERRKELASQ